MSYKEMDSGEIPDKSPRAPEKSQIFIFRYFGTHPVPGWTGCWETDVQKQVSSEKGELIFCLYEEFRADV